MYVNKYEFITSKGYCHAVFKQKWVKLFNLQVWVKKDEADERFTVFFGGPDFGPKFGPSPSWKFPNIFPISDSKFRNVIYQKKNLCTSCQNF